jgi:ribosomal protein S18 acetylase RimI-like enzyme
MDEEKRNHVSLRATAGQFNGREGERRYVTLQTMAALKDIAVIEYDDKYAHDAVAMWRASKERALGIYEVHSFDDHLDFVCSNLVKNTTVFLAIHKPHDSVVGIMALHGAELNQLYVHIDFQRIGIGTQLLNVAKQVSTGKLQLHTFEVNSNAQAFYEKHGFTLIGRGCENEEGLPDIRYQWIRSEVSAV